MNVRITTVTGQEAEITHEELMRLFHTHHSTHHETNEHYQNRAYRNVCEAAKKYGIKNVADTEKEMKELMTFALVHRDSEMLGEIIEWFIAEYTKKTGA
jgi:hypothetical protein